MLMVLLVGLGIYVSLGGLLYLFQSRLVYLPWRDLEATPVEVGLSYQEVDFATADGVLLQGWLVPAELPRATVLFCHGNAGNISHFLAPIQVFHSLGLSTLVFDYRGYGKSQGRPTEQGTYLDAEAAWTFLVEKQQLKPEEIVVCGRSLGGPIAAWLAWQHLPRALILEATFTSIPDLARHLYPIFPARLLTRYEYCTLAWVSQVTCPVLVVHSRQDRLIPFSHGLQLYQAVRGPRAFLEISGGHSEGFELSAEQYREGLEAFLAGDFGQLVPPLLR